MVASIVTLSYPLADHQLDAEVTQDDDADDDAIHAKGREVVVLDVTHEELDREHGDDEGGDDADHKHHDLGRGHDKTGREERLEGFDDAPAKHDGNGKEEGELGRGRTRASREHAADDGRTAAARTRDDGKALKEADFDGGCPVRSRQRS